MMNGNEGGMRKGLAVWACVLMGLGGFLGSTAAVQAQVSATAATLKPGLAVCYIYGQVRHINEIAEWEKHKDCKPGKPLPNLNYRVGEDTVLTSESNDGVMAKITGFVHLEKPGFYSFSFESNDGVRLEIDGQLIVEDPDVHADRYSDIGGIEVTEPGWYPISIQYFERKNTSTLRFFWSPPDVEGTMSLVPREVLAH